MPTTPKPPPAAGPWHQESRPDPDPTVRTIETTALIKDQLLREMTLEREIADSKITAIQHIIETRLDGMDKAIELVQERTAKFPAEILAGITQLQALHDEKFHSIGTQFIERDTRTEQTSRDSKVAVDAALQAAKEAVGEQNKSNALAISKSEAAFTKQIDQIGVLVTTLSKTFDDKIDDIKGRLNAMEGSKKGGADVWAIWFAVTGILIGIASVGVAAVMSVFRGGH